MPLDLPERLQALPQTKLSFSTDNIDGSFTINSIEKSRISREIGNPVTKNCAKELLLRGKRNLHFDFSCRSHSRLIVAARQWSRPETAYRELRLELLCCAHHLSRGTAPHEREYARRKDRF